MNVKITEIKINTSVDVMNVSVYPGDGFYLVRCADSSPESGYIAVVAKGSVYTMYFINTSDFEYMLIKEQNSGGVSENLMLSAIAVALKPELITELK